MSLSAAEVAPHLLTTMYSELRIPLKEVEPIASCGIDSYIREKFQSEIERSDFSGIAKALNKFEISTRYSSASEMNFRRARESRNLLVHNSGTVTKTFLSQCAGLKAELGSRLWLTANDVVDCNAICLELVSYVDLQAVQKYKLREAD